MSIASIYVAARRTAVLLGTTTQLAPSAWHAGQYENADTSYPQKYHYCGSLGPLHLEDHYTEQLQAIGETLAREFGLRGLFGVDAILDDSGKRIVPVEINPRYTASIEVLERASFIGTKGTRGKALQSIRLHVEACEQEKLPERVMPVSNAKSAKAILYVPDDFPAGGRFPAALAQWAAVRNLSSSQPVVADIPIAESPLVAGQPMLTLLEDGDEPIYEIKIQAAECYDILREWNS
jgi:predicted ATP-grasp superfamily ATP-dependent carboligase